MKLSGWIFRDRRDEGMDFMEISKKRRTVRKFAQRPVEAEKVEKILEAGRWGCVLWKC